MDRIFVYPGAIPQDTDVLNTNRNTMIALGYLAQACLGTSMVVDGLACTPTAPASLVVNIGPGSILDLTEIDTNAYGSLALDTDPLVKMGINPYGVTPFTLTAPGTSGQAINYLIEATFLEADTNPVVLPYYNAANPSQPYSGPSNLGSAQNTTRRDTVELAMKAGAAAAIGTQVTPSPDAGYVGLWVVTVTYGQTQITSTSINLYPNAPFIGTKLPNLRTTLSANLQLYVNASTGNDSWSGSAFAPFATIQAAVNAAYSRYNFNNYTLTINVANGTYTTPLTFQNMPQGYPGNYPVYLVGNTSAPGSCIISVTNANAITVTLSGFVNVQGFTLTATGSSTTAGSGLVASSGGLVLTGLMAFGTCGYSHMYAAVAGEIAVIPSGNYTINGSAQFHWTSDANGFITFNNVTITLSGTPAFSQYFAYSARCANIQALSLTFSGSATGTRYTAQLNGVIVTGGAGATYLPGNVSGTTSTGGQYS